TTGNPAALYFSLNAKSYLQRLKGEFNAAVTTANQAYDLVRKANSPYDHAQCYERLWQAYEGKKQYDSVFKYYKLEQEIMDTLTSQDVKQQIENTQLKADIKTAELNQKIRLQKIQARADARIMLRNFILVVVILVFILFFLIFAFRKQRQAKNKHQEYTQKLLTVQEQERSKIAMELHDNIGQNLLMVKNQLSQMKEHMGKTQLSIEMVDKSIDDIRGLSHELHPHILESLGLKRAIHHMLEQVNSISGIYFTEDITDKIDEVLNKDKRIHVYRILQECINNILKHSNARAAKLTINSNNSSLKIVVKDNGIGFNKNLPESKLHKSFGFTSMKERLSILRGNMKIDALPGKGVTLTFNIPF
ncbi:MAG TPA: sensor histidine kinase, partial [Flavobacteriales bacterium]|nr:sensor histidine kinase [Flavobacteriales bacterium]